MATGRELVFLGVGLILGGLLVVIGTGVLGFGSSSIPPGVEGTPVRIEGSVQAVNADEGRLYLNATDRGPTPIAIENATPYECDPGGTLVACESRRSWSWVASGQSVCVDAVLRSSGPPEAHDVFVNAGCDSSPA